MLVANYVYSPKLSDLAKHSILDHEKSKEFVPRPIACMSLTLLDGVHEAKNLSLTALLGCFARAMYHPRDNFFTKGSGYER